MRTSRKSRVRLMFGLGATAFVGYRLVRPWQQRWGATGEEVNEALPGDDLISEAAGQITRAITIAAPREVVWSWLVQLGADRGGFYSYDWLEDLFGLGIHSTDDIVPEWQERAVGDVVYGDAARRGGWYVMDLQPARALVLQTANLKKGRPASCAEGAPMEFTWTFVLHEVSDGTTRLLVRERVAFANGFWRYLLSPLGSVSFVMTQKMMRGIKQRTEAAISSGRSTVYELPRAEGMP
jgi:hypothetical protein